MVRKSGDFVANFRLRVRTFIKFPVRWVSSVNSGVQMNTTNQSTNRQSRNRADQFIEFLNTKYVHESNREQNLHSHRII